MTKPLATLATIFCLAGAILAQTPATPETPPAAPPEDPGVNVAAQWIGRSLFLRCFCTEDNLTFDAHGHAEGSPKTTDWTLAGVQVQKVERKSATEIQLDGLRVAIRYAIDRREFDRHNQNDEKMHIIVADPGDPVALDHELHAIFSEGMDRPLQASMPEFWQHYFDPAAPWPQDDLTGQTIYTMDVPAGGTVNKSTVPPQVTHKAEPTYTAIAARDKVTGTVKMRLVADTEGAPKRVAIVQPLGYGLDAKAAEAATKIRFTPATLNGKIVPATVFANQDFLVVGTPQ